MFPKNQRRLKALLVEAVLHGDARLATVRLGRAEVYSMANSLEAIALLPDTTKVTRKVNKASLMRLRQKLVQVASAETAYGNEYTPEICPFHNHCKAVSYVVQQVFGGVILYALIEGDAHYWNLLPCGTEVDFTASQYDGKYKGDGYAPVATATHILPPLKKGVKPNPRFSALLRQVEALSRKSTL